MAIRNINGEIHYEKINWDFYKKGKFQDANWPLLLMYNKISRTATLKEPKQVWVFPLQLNENKNVNV